ncbi:hypothetical protein CMU15_00460 [Elizabethkingia anophelis]|nr:hypothetical protein [Elizabethkingia anophelis]
MENARHEAIKAAYGEQDELPILCSISGGKTSGFMAVYLRTLYPNRKILFVFANTGREKEETLIFLKRIDEKWNLGIVWVEADINQQKGVGTGYRVVDFESASRNGEPFENAIEKYGLPSKLFRHCTRELKEVPIHKYAKEVLGNEYITAIGIRSDEKHRLSHKEGVIYPLAEMNFDKRFINDWWSTQPFNLELKESEGNCDFCFLKSKRKRINLLKNGLNVDWWNNMELKYGSERQPIFDVRNGESMEDLIKIASEEMNQLSFFDLDDIDFDCFCKAN